MGDIITFEFRKMLVAVNKALLPIDHKLSRSDILELSQELFPDPQGDFHNCLCWGVCLLLFPRYATSLFFDVDLT
jgi:hypothetical protein